MKKNPIRLLVAIGTRPEAIKLAPLLSLLKLEKKFSVHLVSTGQHEELLTQALRSFSLRPDSSLRVMRRHQNPNYVLSSVLNGIDRHLTRHTPDLVIVQGDTTSALGTAMAAFHRKIPILHLEAGLRTRDMESPFPEEMNRLVIDRITTIHCAPTSQAANNLLAEGHQRKSIYTTGNTIVDALKNISNLSRGSRTGVLKAIPEGKKLAIATLHRRENHGPVLDGLITALSRASKRCPDVFWIFPVHPNPNSHPPLERLPKKQFLLIPSLDYPDFIHLLKRSSFIVTDSGGIQEEAATLGVPYLVLRRTTERPETIGRYGILAGINPTKVEKLILHMSSQSRLIHKNNPFGDGHAAERIISAIKHWSGLGPRPRDYRVSP